MLKDMTKTAAPLFAITFLVTLILLLGNYFTKDRIAMRREQAELLTKQQVLITAASFEELHPDVLAAHERLSVGYDENGSVVGYCTTTAARGYGGEITVITGLDQSGTVLRVRVLSHSETTGVGSKAQTNPELFLNGYENRRGPFTLTKSPSADPQGIAAISGATITSDGVNEGVNRAVELTAAIINAKKEGSGDA